MKSPPTVAQLEAECVEAWELLRLEREANAALRARLAEAEQKVKLSNADWAEDHTHAQEVAKRIGIDPAKVDGDSYGVPGITDLIDMIATRLAFFDREWKPEDIDEKDQAEVFDRAKVRVIFSKNAIASAFNRLVAKSKRN